MGQFWLAARPPWSRGHHREEGGRSRRGNTQGRFRNGAPEVPHRGLDPLRGFVATRPLTRGYQFPERACEPSLPRGRLRRGRGRKERLAVGGIGEPVAPAFPVQVVPRVAANQEAVLRQAVRAEAVLGHIDGRVANGFLKESLPGRI